MEEEELEDTVFQDVDAVMTFKEKIEEALRIFPSMTPTQKTESIILWNVVSEKLQGILNKSADALNEVSIIFLRNQNTAGRTSTNISESATTGTSKAGTNYELITRELTPIMATQATTDFITQPLVTESESTTVESASSLSKPTVLGISSFESSEDGVSQMKPSISVTELLEESEKVHVAVATELIKGNPSNVRNEYSNTAIHEDDDLDQGSSGGGCKESVLSLEPNSIDEVLKHSKILLSSLRKRRSKFINEETGSTNKKIDLVVEKNRWSCNSCEKQFDDYLLLQNHIRCDHSVSKFKPIKCNLCDATLSTKSNYNVHLRKHSGERPFSCAKCSVTFTTSNNLRRHMLSHQGVKPYRCSVCDSRFAEKRSLQIHHRTHTGERPYSCTECDSSFRQKSVLKSHMTTHSQEKPFICSECGQKFKNKSLLRSHENRHSGEKKYDCHYCKSAFVTKSDLNRHEQSHRGEKRFTCQEENCGMTFMRKQSLREHENRHQGVKPYTCDKCPKSYPQLSAFRKHQKQHIE